MHKSARDRLRRLELETETQEREQVDLLLDISQAMTSELKLENLLQLIMDRTRVALHADRCSVFLLDPVTRELWTIAAHGIEGGQIRVPADLGLAGHVAMTGKTLNVKDAYADERFDQSVDRKTGYRTRTILSMPMKNRQGGVIGVFQILNKLKGVFTNDDERILRGVVASAAIAVENAQLVHRYQHREFERFIEVLAQAVDARNPVSCGHSQRVARIAGLLAERIDAGPQDRTDLHFAALLHDFWQPDLLADFFRRYGDMDDGRYRTIAATVRLTCGIIDGAPVPAAVKPLLKRQAYTAAPPADAGTDGADRLNAGILAAADLFDMLTVERGRKPRLPVRRVLAVFRNALTGRIDATVMDAFFGLPLDRLLLAMTAGTPYRIGFRDREKLAGHTVADLERSALRRGKRPREEQELLDLFNANYTL